MKPVIFLRSARGDLRAELDYYRTIDPILASRFVAAVELTAALVGQNPETIQVIEAEVRRWPVRGFPHGVLYRVEPKRVVILAVFRPKQDPAKLLSLAGV